MKPRLRPRILPSQEHCPHRARATRNGSALVTTMIVVLVAMSAAGTLFAMSASMPQRVRRMTDAIRAKAIAEAGINRAYSLLRDGYDEGVAAFPLSTGFGDGRYEVTIQPMSGTESRLVSVGRFGQAMARVGADVRNAADDADTGGGLLGGAFRHALFANGNLTYNGTPKSIRGSLHTNNDFSLNGVYDNVQGLIRARNAASIPSSNRGDWAPIAFPKESDPEFAAFLDEARSRGVLTEFDGTTSFPQNTTYEGVVVVRGDLIHNGSGTRTVNGVLYVEGNVTFNGSSGITINGALLAGGNVSFNGASSTTTEFDHDPTYFPDTGQDGEDYVVIDAWWE